MSFFYKEVNVPHNQIGAAYNRAWKKAGLEQFSGSHCLRYAMAQMARKTMGTLESVKALLAIPQIKWP